MHILLCVKCTKKDYQAATLAFLCCKHGSATKYIFLNYPMNRFLMELPFLPPMRSSTFGDKINCQVELSIELLPYGMGVLGVLFNLICAGADIDFYMGGG